MGRKKEFQIDGTTLEKYLGSEPFPVIPDGITEIAEKAFDNKPIRGVRFPYGLASIAEEAFRNCKELKTVVFPETLKEIGDGAFSFCDSLREIQIPASVESIGIGAFAYCENLAEFSFDGTMPELTEMFDNCSITRLVIPEGVVNLDGLCHYCKELKSVRLPESLQNIGYKAFYGCVGLADINLPQNLDAIGDSAFFGCDKLPPEIAEKIRGYNPKAFEMSEEDLQTVDEMFEADGDSYKSDGTTLGDMRELAASMRIVSKEDEEETADSDSKQKTVGKRTKQTNVYLPVERRSVSEKAELSELIPKAERVYIMDKTDRKKAVLKAVFTPFFVFALIWAVIDFGAAIGIIIAAISGKNPAMLLILLFFAVHLLPVYIYIGMTKAAISRISGAQAAVTDRNVWHKSGGSLAVVKLADIKNSAVEHKSKKKSAVVLSLDGGETYRIEELTSPKEFSDRIRRLVDRGDF